MLIYCPSAYCRGHHVTVPECDIERAAGRPYRLIPTMLVKPRWYNPEKPRPTCFRDRDARRADLATLCDIAEKEK
jgi:hypothetical protein